jgi:hypothetical protein
MSLTLPSIAAFRQQQGGNSCHLQSSATHVVKATIQAGIGR